jgi:hypothetical protein
MTKYAKFISVDCAAGAPTTKDGQPYTEEMALADGFLPLETLPVEEGLQNPTPRYKVENGKIIEYYVEGEIIEEQQVRYEEEGDMQRLIDATPTSIN